MDFSFKKPERLHKRDDIELLFKDGQKFFLGPFRVTHLENSSGEAGIKVMIGVPKRNFKKAVDRNLIKRRIREAYRLNRNELKDKLDKKSIHVFIYYQANEKLPFVEIEAKIKLILLRLESIYVQDN